MKDYFGHTYREKLEALDPRLDPELAASNLDIYDKLKSLRDEDNFDKTLKERLLRLLQARKANPQ